MYQDQPLLRDILNLTSKPKYITVRATGLIIPRGRHLKTIATRIIAYGQARTLYRARKPHCRSLNGIKAIKGADCASCHERKHCTPQVRLDVIFENEVFRLLLAYTSAKNFLLYAGGRPAAELEKKLTQITVIDRGGWGELRFSEIRQT